ncbi:MAG: hypothetical protein J07HX5_02157, partial [halophilic archaeon J07HX5]
EAAFAATESVPPGLTLVILAITLVSVVDAYWMAGRLNSGDQPTPPSSSSETDATTTESSTQECPNCGREIDGELTFCHWCTTRVDENG